MLFVIVFVCFKMEGYETVSFDMMDIAGFCLRFIYSTVLYFECYTDTQQPLEINIKHSYVIPVYSCVKYQCFLSIL